MANYNQNRGYQSYDDDRDREMNRRRYGREDEYNRENYSSYGNAGFENDYNKGRREGNYGNMNTGSGSFYNEKNWRRQYEEERYPDMRNVEYGDIYHGNVEQREWETNQARSGRYENKGQGGNYAHDYRRGYGGTQESNYDDIRRRREERGWWDRAKDEMKSWTGDDEAERRREMDRRMVGQHRGKGPKGYTRTDERIREDVCERLSDDSYVDASDIDIKVEGADIVLSGTVNSREEKRRAEDIVESISGVHNVENRLKVNTRSSDNDYSSRYSRDDERRTDYRGDYTGTTDDISGIGKNSGTTNEIIRDVSGNDKLK